MRQLLLISSFVMFTALMLACNNEPKKLEFYYYPARNVYYSVSNNLFFYSLDGGKTWDSLKAKLDRDPVTLGVRQVIYSTSPAIWQENEQHISQFNGHVINLSNNDSTVSDKDLAAERKIKKTQQANTSTTKKPEKKLNFFQRLFGKKNKD